MSSGLAAVARDSQPQLHVKPPRAELFQETCRQISFLHPGYPDKHNILLILPAFDSDGIHHETARVACAILANSRWDGFLSLSKSGARLDILADGILTAPQYYFCVEDDNKYPIVPSFDHYTCPPTLPDSWSEEQVPIEHSDRASVLTRDRTCRITNYSVANETAHIIPKARNDWWQSNSMFLYATVLSLDIECSSNAILLRRDLHKMWDDHHFAIVPKSNAWVMHVLCNGLGAEIEQEHHNLSLQPLQGVSRHFLLCRFALAIFSRSVFLHQRFRRRLLTLTEAGDARVRSMSPGEYRIFAQSRSRSPRKRQRSRHCDTDNNNGEDADDSCTLISRDTESDDDIEEEEQRGRPRKRVRVTVCVAIH